MARRVSLGTARTGASAGLFALAAVRITGRVFLRTATVPALAASRPHVYQVLSTGEPYHERGRPVLDEKKKVRLIQHHIRRLGKLGVKTYSEPLTVATAGKKRSSRKQKPAPSLSMVDRQSSKIIFGRRDIYVFASYMERLAEYLDTIAFGFSMKEGLKQEYEAEMRSYYYDEGYYE